MARDYYEVLGVSRDATADEIQQAYRKLARQHHPDVNKDPAAEERFKEINEAYHVLSDPETRKRYDRFGEDFRQVPEDWEERVRRWCRWRRWLRRRRAIRSAGALPARASAAPAAASTSRTSSAACSAAAAGLRADSGRRPGGRAGADRRGGLPGRHNGTIIGLDGRAATRSTSRRASSTASASGWRGQGGRGSGGGPAGDLYLVVRIKPHPRFRVDGRDITVDLPVTPWEAALGATVAGRHSRRRGEGEGAARVVERPAAAAARRRHAQPARCRRRPLRRDQGDGATETHRRGNASCSRNWRRSPRSTRGGGR